MKKFRKLRAAMVEGDIDQRELARELGLTQQAVSAKLSGRAPWTLCQAYMVMEVLELDLSRLPLLFPEDEITEKPRLCSSTDEADKKTSSKIIHPKEGEFKNACEDGTDYLFSDPDHRSYHLRMYSI